MLFFVLIGGVRPTAAQQAPRFPCTADTADAVWLVAELLDQALATDSASVNYWRDHRLPRPTPDAIRFERDPAACDRVLRAFYREEGEPRPFRPGAATVVRVGEGWIVTDPEHRVGEWLSVLTFDGALGVVRAELR